MVNADVEPITSVPCALFLGTKDDMLSVDGLGKVRLSPPPTHPVSAYSS
jgi:hypothetical protein